MFVCNAARVCFTPAGPEAAEACVEPAAHFHRGHLQHHGGARHGGVERDTPQDRDAVQRVGARLPRPQLPGQCAGRAGIPGGDGGVCERAVSLAGGMVWGVRTDEEEPHQDPGTHSVRGPHHSLTRLIGGPLRFFAGNWPSAAQEILELFSFIKQRI